eukprot:10372787-Lingulodinium_polyedra.AAC.1
MEIADFPCSCPQGTPHGSDWGDRSVYNSAPGASSLKLQHEVAFLRKLLAGVELTRPLRRREAPFVPDSFNYSHNSFDPC